MTLDPTIITVFTALFVAGAAAAIVVYKKVSGDKPAPSGSPNPSLNGGTPPENTTGRFTTHSVEHPADIALTIVTLEAKVDEIARLIMNEGRLAQEERREARKARAADKLRSEATHSLAASVEMVAIQGEHAAQEHAELLREIKNRR